MWYSKPLLTQPKFSVEIYNGYFLLSNSKIYLLMINHFIKLYIIKGNWKKIYSFFFNCFSILKKKIRSNLFYLFKLFIIEHCFSFAIKQCRKSGKLYSVPWFLIFARTYRKIWHFLKLQISLRTENSLELKIVSELSALCIAKEFSMFYKAKKNLFLLLINNKHNLSLISK